MKNILISIFIFSQVGVILFFCFRSTGNVKEKINLHPIDFKLQSDIWGIDISHHQGKIEWGEVKKADPSFVIVKATEAVFHKDSKFKSNIESANSLNIPVGAYHFFSYRFSGKMQARHFLDVVGDEADCIPLVLDVEYHSRMNRMSNISKNILEFVNVVKESTGKYPIIYANCWYYDKYVKPVLGDKPEKWIASYTYKPSCGYMMHQSTDRHRLKGIDTYVDYNAFLGDKEDFNRIFFPCKTY